MGNYTGKAKVESVEQTAKGGYAIKLSGGYSGSVLYTGYQGKDMPKLPLPDYVKTGAEVDLIVKEIGSGEKSWDSLSFPSASGGVASSHDSGGWKGSSKEDTALKLVSFSMSYAKDLFTSTPDATLSGMFETADKIADKMNEMYNRLK